MEKNDRLNMLVRLGKPDEVEHNQSLSVLLESEDNIKNFKELLSRGSNSKAIIYAFKNGKFTSISEEEIDLVITEDNCYWNVL